VGGRRSRSLAIRSEHRPHDGAKVACLHVCRPERGRQDTFQPRTHPETPASSLPDVFIVVTSVAVVVGAVIGLRGAERRSRRPITVVASLVAAGAGVTSAARQAGDVPVTAANVDYPERVDLE